MPKHTLQKTKDIEKQIKKIATEISLEKPIRQDVGYVSSIGDGIATIVGLNAQMQECVEFENGEKGIISRINSQNEAVAVLVRGSQDVCAGDIVKSTKNELLVPVGSGLIGRVVNALGEPVDGLGDLVDVEYVSYDSPSPAIIEREGLSEPYHTGTSSVDFMIPIGRGQRELIIGDPDSGKTTIALDAMIHQSNISSEIVTIYVAIGQKLSSVAGVVETLRAHGAMQNSVVVVATASDSAMSQFIAPMTGCAIGQYFMRQGKHASIVYDDLSKHAYAHRQISLLLRTPPGREAYPGDTFYVHARLLERGGKLRKDLGGGSLTALPIIVTNSGDITGYVPTNVISITDGQIFLDSKRFKGGDRPAVDVGLSVSRVGSAAQWKCTKKIAGNMKVDLAQFEESKKFAALSGESDTIEQQNRKCATIVKLLMQDAGNPIPQEMQCLLFLAARHNCFDLENIKEQSRQFMEVAKIHGAEVLKEIRDTEKLAEDLDDKLCDLIKTFKSKTEQNSHHPGTQQ